MADLMGAIGTGATIGITIKAIDNFSKTFSSITGAINTSIGIIGGLTAGLVALGSTTLKAAGDFEQTTIAFTTMLGSGEAATKMLKDLADFAKKTPFTIQGVETAAKKLMAVGFEAEEIIPTLKSVGDVASGLGLGQEGLDRLILNLGQVQSQGKLTGRELRDFAIAGVPLLAELAKNLGTTEAAVTEMVSKGEISTADVTKAFETMSSEGGRFANLMSKQMDTVQGKFSNIKDALQITAREMGAAFLPAISSIVDVLLTDLLPAIQPLIPLVGEFFTQAIQTLAPYIQQLVQFLSEFGQLLFGEILPQMTPLIDMFMQFMMNAIMPLFNALTPLLPVLFQVGALLLNIATQVIQALLPVLMQLIPIIVDFFKQNQPLIESLGLLIVNVAQLAALVLDLLMPVINHVSNNFKFLGTILSIIIDLINIGIAGFLDLVYTIMNALAPAIDWVKDKFSGFINIVKGVYEWIIKVIDGIRDFLGLQGKVSSSNASSSAKKVKDAVISPAGNVISTDPADYIIATKNPGSLSASNGGITINIENLNATSPEDVAQGLNDILRKKLSI